MEGVENIKKHNYKFAPGKTVNIDFTSTQQYDVCTISGEGEIPHIEDIEHAFDEAKTYFRIIQELIDKKITREEALPQISNNRMGFKNILLSTDYMQFELYNGTTYWILLKFRPSVTNQPDEENH